MQPDSLHRSSPNDISLRALEELSSFMKLDSPIMQMEPEILRASDSLGFSVDNNGDITDLSLSGRPIDKIPPVILSLQKLSTLRLFRSWIGQIPDEIADFRQLRSLYLSGNMLSEIPESVLSLEHLRLLALNNNKIRILPYSVAKLTQLETLGLSGNSIEEISAVASLSKLTRLFVGRNPLHSLPEGIWNLSHLSDLLVNDTPLQDLPEGICNCQKLTTLDVSSTQLENPTPIFAVATLRRLGLRNLGLEAIDASIGRLKRLEILDLSSNPLSALPDELFSIPGLRSLDMSNLALDSFPLGIFQLQKLRYLNLSQTPIHTLPSEIGRASEIEHLDVSGCGLTSIPPVLFGMDRLKYINLSGNRIRRLPPQVATFDGPITFSERPNSLGSLNAERPWPAERPRGLVLKLNPLEEPPIEVVAKGQVSIKRYFAALRGERKAVNEAKVLLVGDGGAGKTSLMKRLLERQFDPQESQTHGINIDELTVDAAGRHLRVHLWDFGGQEIMHATHQFFLSKRSAYVLVADSRRDDKIEYWLKHIEAFGGTSPILIVINKIDEHPSFDLNRRFLAEKYKSIVAFVRASCSTGEGIADVWRTLVPMLARLESTTTIWPASWFAVKERVELLRSDYISYSDFRRACTECAIVSEDEQRDLAEFLHDLGIALHFRDLALRDTNVISPHWLTNGVYPLVNSAIIANSGGILDIDALDSLLDRGRYPEEKHNFIIEMMKKFELCYSISSHRVLFPTLLPIEEPKRLSRNAVGTTVYGVGSRGKS